MSWQATSWVTDVVRRPDEAPKKAWSTRKYILLVLANEADSCGVTWKSQASIATMAEVSRVAVAQALGDLEAYGLIRRVCRRRQNGTRSTDLIMLAPSPGERGQIRRPTAEDYSPDIWTYVVIGNVGYANVGREGGPDVSSSVPTGRNESVKEEKPKDQPLQSERQPEPSRAHTRTREAAEERLREGLPVVRFANRAVPPSIASRAAVLLDHFNARAAQRRQRFKPDGTLTEDFKRVVSAVISHPDVEVEQWRKIVDGVLAFPWWDGGPPTPGVVFGAKVVDDNIAAPTRGQHKRPRLAVVQDDFAAAAAHAEEIRNRRGA